MPRQQPVFECTACGHRASKWLGRCPGCGGWNTLEALPDELRRAPGAAATDVEPVSLALAAPDVHERTSTGISGADRVLGGGLVPGAAILLAGEPGVGKSTLVLQLAAARARGGTVLYATAEESVEQVASRARRLGLEGEELLLLAEPVLENVVAAAARVRPLLLVADSVQTIRSDRVPAVPGTVSQVREVAGQLVELGKRQGMPVILVGHITKEGLIAGPKALEHLVDVVLDFSGAANHQHRALRSTKNRYGPAFELALFAMTGRGLEEVSNPSAALLADRVERAPGSAVAVVLEGTTPLLVEVQALVSRSSLPTPRRVAQGVDPGRLALLLAVLEKRAGLRLSDRDVFVNVVGGFEVDEPGLDAALAAAIVSSARERPVAFTTALFGEVGLLGEIRAVPRPEERVREAVALGFERCAIPASSADVKAEGIGLLPLRDVGALASVLDPPA